MKYIQSLRTLCGLIDPQESENAPRNSRPVGPSSRWNPFLPLGSLRFCTFPCLSFVAVRAKSPPESLLLSKEEEAAELPTVSNVFLLLHHYTYVGQGGDDFPRHWNSEAEVKTILSKVRRVCSDFQIPFEGRMVAKRHHNIIPTPIKPPHRRRRRPLYLLFRRRIDCRRGARR